jgi:tRNA threonylcarbamoyladenosine biosynthesis protein TsaE
MAVHFHSQSEAETVEIGKNILEVCKNRKIFAIFGELGAGKTMLVKAFCAALKVPDAVKSPTFSLVNEYQGPLGSVYHFDFYRIRKQEEAYDIGIEEYLDSGAWCFIEWPERIPDLIPEEAVKIRITAEGNNLRTFEVE